MQKLSSRDFEKAILASEEPVLVEFYATWCEACKSLAPVLDKFIEETKIKGYKIDVEEAEGLANKYNVEAVPTTFFFARRGKVELRLVGTMPRKKLEEALAKVSS